MNIKNTLLTGSLGLASLLYSCTNSASYKKDEAACDSIIKSWDIKKSEIQYLPSAIEVPNTFKPYDRNDTLSFDELAKKLPLNTKDTLYLPSAIEIHKN